MSFQNFRLQPTPSQPTPVSAHDNVTPGALLHSIPLTVHQPPHPAHPIQQANVSDVPQDRRHHVPSQDQPTSPMRETASRPPTKAPYGSGDAEDGYTLVFASMALFEQWREKEETEKMVEFVKGDTHGSKAVPPRFKDHTKLVCARHQRSGRKKYVKKYPERQRKVPSRKLEGVGCPASISYKTYYETDEVRVMYNDQHSHEIGESNLPYTRRGRRMEAARQKFKGSTESDGNEYPMSVPLSGRENGMSSDTAHASSSASHGQMGTMDGMGMGHGGMGGGPSAISMVAPLPPPQQMGSSSAVSGPNNAAQERWDRLEVLFQSIRGHARSGFDYPGPSVAALESVLIRLYLESPMRGGGT